MLNDNAEIIVNSEKKKSVFMSYWVKISALFFFLLFFHSTRYTGFDMGALYLLARIIFLAFAFIPLSYFVFDDNSYKTKLMKWWILIIGLGVIVSFIPFLNIFTAAHYSSFLSLFNGPLYSLDDSYMLLFSKAFVNILGTILYLLIFATPFIYFGLRKERRIENKPESFFKELKNKFSNFKLSQFLRRKENIAGISFVILIIISKAIIFLTTYYVASIKSPIPNNIIFLGYIYLAFLIGKGLTLVLNKKFLLFLIFAILFFILALYLLSGVRGFSVIQEKVGGCSFISQDFFRYHCFQEKAKETKDVLFCNLIPNDYYRKEYLYKSRTGNAKIDGYEWLYNHEQSMRLSCILVVLRESKLANLNVCNNLQDTQKDMCYSEIILSAKLAEVDQNINICNEIKNVFYKNECLVIFAINNENFTICEDLIIVDNDFDSLKLKNSCFITEAIYEGVDEACQKISSDTSFGRKMQKNCNNTLYALANKNTTYCEENKNCLEILNKNPINNTELVNVLIS